MEVTKMKEIKRVNGRALRRELERLEKLTIEYDTLQGKLDQLNDVIYSHHNKTQEEINILMAETSEIENQLATMWEKLMILELFKSIENGEQEDNQELQSLFIWIFYLFNVDETRGSCKKKLQSLFIWIFYLFVTLL